MCLREGSHDLLAVVGPLLLLKVSANALYEVIVGALRRPRFGILIDDYVPLQGGGLANLLIEQILFGGIIGFVANATKDALLVMEKRLHLGVAQPLHTD